MGSTRIWVTTAALVIFASAALLAQSDLPSRSKAKPKTASIASAQQIRELHDLVLAQQKMMSAQQQQIESQHQQMDQMKSQLQQLLAATQQANAAAQKGQSSADQAQQSAAEAQRLADQASANAVEAKTQLSLVNNTTQDQGKRLSALSDLINRFRFSGDVRLRGESFFQNTLGFFDRNRGRVRARFGFDSRLNDDFAAGIFLATGSLADVTSTNETLTNFFERKTIALDRAFIAYQLVAHPWIQLTAGKWSYTWNRTSLTFDPDINPEGFSEKFSWDLKNPVVKNLAVGGIQLLYNEVSAGTDSYAIGTQASTRLQFGPWTATPQFFALKWNNPSAILQASGFAAQATKGTDSNGDTINLTGEGPGCAGGSAGSTKLPSTPLCAIASNGFTNAVFTNSKGIPQLWSNYFYTDYLLDNEIKTGIKRLPLNVLLEFQDNIDAASHPLDTKGKVISGLGPQNKGYLGEASLGENKNRNDVRFGYGYWRQEQDAILATFAESEGRASTNILEHHFFVNWNIEKNVLATFSLWRGRTLNTNLENNAALVQKAILKAGQPEPYLNRYQFDLSYKF